MVACAAAGDANASPKMTTGTNQIKLGKPRLMVRPYTEARAAEDALGAPSCLPKPPWPAVAAHAKRGRMSRLVQCVKFGKEMPGLDRPPFKGEMGQKIFDNVSKEAWRMWIEHSKMLVNEFRLDLTSEQGQKIWMAECDKYFYGEGSQLPPDFVAKHS
jgi:Fe-S cluster biosynthesis and repair protein YggX